MSSQSTKPPRDGQRSDQDLVTPFHNSLPPQFAGLDWRLAVISIPSAKISEADVIGQFGEYSAPTRTYYGHAADKRSGK
jgi:hypothetical protein